MITRRHLLGVVLVALLAQPTPGWSNDGDGSDDHGDDHGANSATASDSGSDDFIPRKGGNDDQGAARNAVSRGKAVSLREVLDEVDRDIGGEVVDVRLVNGADGLRYDLKLIDRRGRLIEITVDALTKDIRKIRGF